MIAASASEYRRASVTAVAASEQDSDRQAKAPAGGHGGADDDSAGPHNHDQCVDDDVQPGDDAQRTVVVWRAGRPRTIGKTRSAGASEGSPPTRSSAATRQAKLLG